MGRRGPRPQPTAIRVLKGNPGKRRLNENEPIPPAGDIRPPDWLRDTGLKVWDALAPTVQAMGVLTTADRLTFARYCDVFGLWLDNEALIRDKYRGQTTYTRLDEKGGILYVGEIPQAAVRRKLHSILLKYEAEFGLTPAARSRIRVEQATTPPAQTKASEADEIKRNFFASRGRAPSPPRAIAGA